MPWEQRVGVEGHDFHIAIPNTAAGASEARKQFTAFIQSFGLDDGFLGDIEAVVGEALANATEHGYKPRGTIRVSAWLTEECVEAVIADDGPGFSLRRPISTEHPALHSPRGYGLFLMRALVDELEFRDDGKTVWFRKHIRIGKEQIGSERR